MADNQRSTAPKTEGAAAKNEDTTGIRSAGVAAGTGSGDDDEKRRETQRQRNIDIVGVQEFDGDLDELRASGVPEQLLKGNDPDARLIA